MEAVLFQPPGGLLDCNGGRILGDEVKMLAEEGDAASRRCRS